MIDGLGDNVTWYCDNCDNIMPPGHEAYRMPDGTILCSNICVDDYAFMHNDDADKADSDVLADTWDKVQTFVIPKESEI